MLVSLDGESWGLIDCRPERHEYWNEPLDRGILEEACASVEEASLLGFGKGVCTRGKEEGLVLVRSFWRAAVSLHRWEPQYEIKHKLLVPSDEALERIDLPDWQMPIFQRWFDEALAT